MNLFLRQISRELRLAFRQRADLMLVVLFFALVAALFPFAIGPQPNLLILIAPGVLWVAAMLSVLLSIERLFLADYEDGTLDLLVIGPLPLELLILAKTLVNWVTTALPLIIATPVVSVIYGLSGEAVGWLMLAMLLGTPSLSLTGAIGAALTLGTRRGGILIPLLVLPLYVPTLIFGALGAESALAGLSATPYFLLLGAITLVMLFVAPLAAAAALRQAAE